MRFAIPVIKWFRAEPTGVSVGDVHQFYDRDTNTYLFSRDDATGQPLVFGQLKFQSGPVREAGINGLQVDDLIALVIQRVQSLNVGEFSDPYNDETVEHLVLAMRAQEKRRLSRQARGVEGTSQP